MRTAATALATMLALALSSSVGHASTPGINLSWSSCGLTSVTSNWNFACDDNTQAKRLVASFRLADPAPDYVGISIVISYIVGAGSTMPWWEFAAAGCREGAFGTVAVPDTVVGCTSPYVGRVQDGGWVIEREGPSRWRLRADWAVDAPVGLAANRLYSGVVLELSTERSFDDGSGACAGCDRQACFVLDQLQVFTYSHPGIFADIVEMDVRNWVTYQNAYLGDGCYTPTRPSTWGAVKALYR